MSVREETEEFLDSSDQFLTTDLGAEVVNYLFLQLDSLAGHEWTLTPAQEFTLTREIILLTADFLDKEGISAEALTKQQETTKQEIYDSGREAYEHGVGMNQCPHAAGTDARKWWVSGFSDAEAEDED